MFAVQVVYGAILSIYLLFGIVTPCGPVWKQFSYKYHKSVPFNHYRIEDDPKQVRPDVVSQSNLFAWLNLKNLVKFKLWTRKNPVLAHEIRYRDLESLKTSSFNPRRITKLVVHGFADTATNQATTYYLLHLRDAYLSLADLNVIIMDYSLFTIPLFYWSGFPDIASARLAEFLTFLEESGGARLDSFHLVGFSWGAHVAGLAGYTLKGRLGRITGLDPAGPSFRFVDNDFRLDKSDAKFVDIIHTNGGPSLFYGGYLGNFLALGDVDVYPNGGSKQIGCPILTPLNYESWECSHGRSVRMFTESITSPLAFPSCKCDSLKRFVKGECLCGKGDIAFTGEHISHRTRGSYQLITRSHKPFGHGPFLNVTLPDIFDLDENMKENLTSSKNKISTNFNNQIRKMRRNNADLEFQQAFITYKDQLISMNYTNTFTSEFSPNDDIVRMCFEALRKVNVTNFVV